MQDLNDSEEQLVRGVIDETIAQLKNMRLEREKSKSPEYLSHAKIALGFVACYVKLRSTMVSERMLELKANGFIETSSQRSKQKALR